MARTVAGFSVGLEVVLGDGEALEDLTGGKIDHFSFGGVSLGSIEISKEIGFAEVVPLTLAVIQISSPLGSERLVSAPPKMRYIGRFGSLVPVVDLPARSARLGWLSSVAWVSRIASGMLMRPAIMLGVEDGMVVVGGYKPFADILDHVMSSLAGVDSCAVRADHFIL